MALKEGEKWWLEEHREELTEHVNARETIARLRTLSPELFDSQDEDDILLRHQTPREQTGALLDLLTTRAREGLNAFRQVVSIFQPSLASLLWPVSYQVLWLCPSPQHAAVTAHLLKRFTNTEFLSSQEEGPGYLSRRSYGGAFGNDGTLVKLVFPTRPEHFPQMLRDTCSEMEQSNLVILTGCCEARGPGLPAGQVVVPLSAGEEGQRVSCRAAGRVRDLQVTLETRLRNAVWREEHAELYRRHAYLDYCSAWLERLYVEMTRASHSTWMETQGVAEDERGGVVCRIPEWGTGELANYVLTERRSWNVDHTSPLGISPRPDLVSHTSEKISRFDSFPSPMSPTPPSAPVFNPLSTGGDGVESPPASQFFTACSSQLSTAWLACLAVCHHSHYDNPHLSAHTAVTMAMEIVQIFVSMTII